MTDKFAHRRPESVLVVIYTCAMECLLLERVEPAGFWQSVTGTLEWNESPLQAARREVEEETGINPHRLIDAKVSHTFTILPRWQPRYGPDVRENREHVWYLEIAAARPIRLDPQEHTAYRWLPLQDAVAQVSSWTNCEALRKLPRQRH